MSDPIGYAVIGAGLVGPKHAEFVDLIDGAEVRAICDLREDRGRALADRHGATWLADYRDLVERDDIQAVSICLPTSLHLEVVETLAAAGKHLLVEKPLETDPGRARSLIEACRKHGVKLATIFNRRFVHATLTLQRAVADGRLGRVLVADMIFKSWRPPEYYSDSGWRGTWDQEGGGALINQGIHGVDLMTWIAGPITRVQAVSRHLRHSHIEADDTTIAVCEYESGAVGVIQGTTSIYPRQLDRIEVHGEHGSVFLEDYKISRWQLEGSEPEPPDERLEQLPGGRDGTSVGHYLQLEDLINAIREDRDPVITGEDALHSLAVVEAIYTSERERRPVDVRPL